MSTEFFVITDDSTKPVITVHEEYTNLALLDKLAMLEKLAIWREGELKRLNEQYDNLIN